LVVDRNARRIRLRISRALARRIVLGLVPVVLAVVAFRAVGEAEARASRSAARERRVSGAAADLPAHLPADEARLLMDRALRARDLDRVQTLAAGAAVRPAHRVLRPRHPRGDVPPRERGRPPHPLCAPRGDSTYG
jgi:hypothetical protein